MESMESHKAGFPPFPHSLEIPLGFPHYHRFDDGYMFLETRTRKQPFPSSNSALLCFSTFHLRQDAVDPPADVPIGLPFLPPRLQRQADVSKFVHSLRFPWEWLRQVHRAAKLDPNLLSTGHCSVQTLYALSLIRDSLARPAADLAATIQHSGTLATAAFWADEPRSSSSVTAAGARQLDLPTSAPGRAADRPMFIAKNELLVESSDLNLNEVAIMASPGQGLYLPGFQHARVAQVLYAKSEKVKLETPSRAS
jgi:hypothetical protein